MLQALDEFVERRLLLGAADKRLLGAFLRGHVVLHTNRMSKAAFAVQHADRRNGRPYLDAVATLETFLDGVTVDFAAHLATELRLVGLRAVGQEWIENRAAEQFLRSIADQRSQMGVHAQKSSIGVDFGNADPGMLIGRGEPAIPFGQLRGSGRSLERRSGPPKQGGRPPSVTASFPILVTLFPRVGHPETFLGGWPPARSFEASQFLEDRSGRADNCRAAKKFPRRGTGCMDISQNTIVNFAGCADGSRTSPDRERHAHAEQIRSGAAAGPGDALLRARRAGAAADGHVPPDQLSSR